MFHEYTGSFTLSPRAGQQGVCADGELTRLLSLGVGLGWAQHPEQGKAVKREGAGTGHSPLVSQDIGSEFKGNLRIPRTPEWNWWEGSGKQQEPEKSILLRVNERCLYLWGTKQNVCLQS